MDLCEYINMNQNTQTDTTPEMDCMEMIERLNKEHEEAIEENIALTEKLHKLEERLQDAESATFDGDCRGLQIKIQLCSGWINEYVEKWLMIIGEDDTDEDLEISNEEQVHTLLTQRVNGVIGALRTFGGCSVEANFDDSLYEVIFEELDSLYDSKVFYLRTKVGGHTVQLTPD